MPETEPDARRPPRVTWGELGRDLLRPGRAQLLVAVVLALCGLAVTMQLRGADDRRYSTLRQAELVAVLDDVTAETRRLEADIAQLESTRRQLESGADASALARAEAQRRLESLRLLGGTLPAEGPGIRVTLHDPAGLITAEIMLNAIEELRDAGAEILELNNEVRLVASSWLRTEDGALVVDGVRLEAPYVIEAIGDAATLGEATRFRGGLVSTIESDRVQGRAVVVELDELAVESVADPAPPEYARPG